MTLFKDEHRIEIYRLLVETLSAEGQRDHMDEFIDGVAKLFKTDDPTFDADDFVNDLWRDVATERGGDEKHWWSTSSGRIELELTADDARCGSHQGPCDDDIADLRRVPYIRDQLDKFGPVLLAEELKEWGAWDENELADHDQNLSRILWLACGGIVDELHEHTG